MTPESGSARSVDGADGGFSGVTAEIAESGGLPNVWYVDPTAVASEHRRLFASEWVAIGTASSLSQPGELHPVELNGVPLVMVRDRDGQLRVFHNVCSHRGLKLVDAPCRTSATIRCPYHSWSYALTGALMATPIIGGPGIDQLPGFDRRQHGLKPVRSHIWLDQVFVNLDGRAPAFEDRLAPLIKRWGWADASRLKPAASHGTLRFEIACNWKLAVENFCDAYHLPWVHPSLNTYSKLEDHEALIEPDLYSGQISRVYDPLLAEDGSSFPCLDGLDDYWRHAAEYISLFPNLLLGLHRDHLYTIRLEPKGHDRVVEHLQFYYVDEGATAEAYAPLRQRNQELWRQVFAEDVAMVENLQRGRLSPAFRGGVFSSAMDGANHAFHLWAARRLSGAART